MGEQITKEQEGVVQLGQLIAGRYEVVKHLGAGGFAQVFRAFDRRIERDVAIKFLNLKGMHVSQSGVKTILERFEREAKLAARIPHRNVVNIFDIGQVDEDPFRPFIVMELLQGKDMDEYMVKDGPMAPARLIPLFIDCLDALGQAHAAGIVHKDLKPSNLFLSDPGQRAEALRIVDFGIAHIKGGAQDTTDAERGGRLTATGQILGTLQYLTPEYIASQIVTPALDVYQMGLILVELLSGEPVIKTDNAFECLRIHTFGLLELPEYLLQSALGPVLKQALDAEYERRYPNAAAFADALSKVDVQAIPLSPRLQDQSVKTAPYLTPTLDHTSKPVFVTADHKRPTTAELSAKQTQRDVALDAAMAQTHDEASLSKALAGAGVATEAAPLEGAHPFAHVDLSGEQPYDKTTGASAKIQSSLKTREAIEPISSPDALVAPPPAGSGRLKIIAGALVTAIALCGGVIVMLMNKAPAALGIADASLVKNDVPVVETPPVPEVEQPKPDVQVEAPKPEDAPKPEEAQVEPKPVTAQTGSEVKLVVLEPQDAKITYGRKSEIGSFTHNFGKKRKPISVTVEAPGYETRKLKLSPDQPRLEISLVPKAAAAPVKDDSQIEEALKAAQALKRKQEEEALAARLKAEREELERQEREAKARIEAEAERLRKEQERLKREAEQRLKEQQQRKPLVAD